MPGAPAFSPRLAIPRYADTDPAEFSSQVNGVTDQIDAAAAKLVPVVLVLPSNPADGDEVFYVADSVNGVTWHLRYRAASTSAYKWEFVGGSDIQTSPVNGTFGAGNTGNSGSGGPPAITIVLPGDYDAEFFAAANVNQGSYLVSSWQPVSIGHGVYSLQSGSSNGWMPIAERWRFTGLANGQGLQVVLDNRSGTQLASVFNMQLCVRPVRVG